MPIDVTVQHRDGQTVTATVWPSTEVEFEDHFEIVWSEAFARDHVPQKYLYFVAYHAEKDAGKTGLNFPEWLRTVASVAIAGEPADPSPPVAPPGS
jgi:hypothetical protein